MERQLVAHFEVYILNYNGSVFLPECLKSLRSVELGSNSLNVNVVDNGSTDRSQALVAKDFPEVNYIPLGSNYGFSKGNNLGVIARKKQLALEGRQADVHVLLNNDTKVEHNWLLGAAEVLERDADVGIVGSKALFYDHFVPLTISTYDCYRPSELGFPDDREFGVFLHSTFEGQNVRTEMKRCKLVNAYSKEEAGCPLAQESIFYVPIVDPSKKASISFQLENRHPTEDQLRVRIGAPKQEKILEVTVSGHHSETVRIELLPEQYQSLVQNAGSFVTPSWHGGDRGFLQPDDGRFDQEEECASICGVSMFVRDAVWTETGGFDEKYFAYYEDTDLCLRARIAGWKCVYAPRSVLRHIHCGSGVEFSDYFNKNVACSHLIFASKMMSQKGWQAKKQECKKLAFQEFQTFKIDGTLSYKPHLTAYCRYIKRFPYFAKNRLQNLFIQPGKRLKAFPHHLPDKG